MLCMLAFAVVPTRYVSSKVNSQDNDTTLSEIDSILDVDTSQVVSQKTDSQKIVRQLTVDSVLNSITADSILNMLQSGTVLEVKPDSSKMDTLKRDTIRQSKSALDEPVQYTAKDSITFDYANSRANLYGDGKINYRNLELMQTILP